MGRVLKQICVIPKQELFTLEKVQENLVSSASMIGTLFFASVREHPSRPLNTPLTVCAIAMAKLLEIYAGILMVRVLFTWFPNIPWDRWPLSAVRDLCDPYLNLFRNILPPVMGTLDVSPLLAFQVLNILTTILNNMGAY
ncbi:ylmG-like protein [Thalictrum thalictroides]|uniref:Ylmg-like protein n=1 Tax=Thalictrum thalictroides TaxID=46969 RepID=A0A7J6UUY9_THATH|nr:Ylmg-like protein [Thalictrum thalictroides]KAF5196541.1 ylmG-like protein [Thalictrum thalictroides]